MATITLTDRVSVRVTAKDSTESSDQKKRDGGNTATALGGKTLTDSEKEELGDDLGETVTGEDGKTYARSEKVAGVLKKLSQEGKLEEPTEVHQGITDSATGFVYTIPYIIPGGTPVRVTNENNLESLETDRFTGLEVDIPGVAVGAFVSNSPTVNTQAKLVLFSKESFGEVSGDIKIVMRDGYTSGNRRGGSGSRVYARNETINNISYSYFWVSIDMYSSSSPGMAISSSEVEACGYSVYRYPNAEVDINKCIAGYLFGAVSQSGGPKVDPTGKTDAQIQKDLEDFAALNNCKMTSESGDSYIAVTDENGNPLYFLGT